jgi:protocatechuate 3,4-dioxygenase beta subunit
VAALSPGLLPAVSDPIALDGERPAASVDLLLAPAESIAGVVLTRERSPIEGARIEARRRADHPARPAGAGVDARKTLLEMLLATRSGAARSDGAGRFEIGGLLGGSYDLEVTAEGFGRTLVAEAPAREEALEVFLERELFLRGEVVDRDRRLIAGAGVRLTLLATDLLEWGRAMDDPHAIHLGESGEDGRFEIGGLVRGPHRAEADCPGYLRKTADVTVHDSRNEEENFLLFELEDGHRIRGVVRKKGGEPLAGARVRLAGRRGDRTGRSGRRDDGDRDVRATITDAAGVFDFPSLAAGAYRLEVAAALHRGRVLDDIPTDGKVLELVLEHGSPLCGRVVDQRSGEPVRGAAVAYVALDGTGEAAAADPAARTDGEGRFRIDGVPGSGHTLRAEAEGYLPLETDPGEPRAGTEVLLELERSGAVSGRLSTGFDASVEGLLVSLVRCPDPAGVTGEEGSAELSGRMGRMGRMARSGEEARVAYADADGYYTVSVPEAGTYRVIAEGHPFVPALSPLLTIPDERTQVEGVDLSMSLGAAVRGVVAAQDGRRLAGASVVLVDAGDGAADGAGSPSRSPEANAVRKIRGIPVARTDATGAFEISGLHAGAYVIVAVEPGYISPDPEEVFELAPGGVHVVVLELEREMTIAGRVSTASDEPIESAEVHAVASDLPSGGGEDDDDGAYWGGERTLSNVLGAFRLVRLADRRYDLRVRAEGLAPVLVRRVAAGSEDVVVRLEPLVSLSGTVLGAFTEEPVTEFRLRLELEDAERLSASERQSLESWREFADPGGAFSIDGLPPGRYLIHVGAPGHLDPLPVGIDVPSAEKPAILLTERGLIMGVVVDAHGLGVSGARVEALERWFDPETGRLSYRPVRVRARAPRAQEGERGGGDGAGKDEGDGDGDGDRDAQGDGEGDRDRDGRGGRGRREGRDGDERTDRAFTRGDGGFALRGLPDGAYRVSVVHEDHLPRELGDFIFENGVSGDGPIALSILLASGVTLLGKVRGLEEVQGGVSISLSPVPRDPEARGGAGGRGYGRGFEGAGGFRRVSGRKSTRVDESGRFEIRGLAVGNYVLHARYHRAADGSLVSRREELRIHDAGREQGYLLDLSR